jgi:hypothetical protein
MGNSLDEERFTLLCALLSMIEHAAFVSGMANDERYGQLDQHEDCRNSRSTAQFNQVYTGCLEFDSHLAGFIVIEAA